MLKNINRKHYATNPKDMEFVQDGNLEIRNFNNLDFKGDIDLGGKYKCQI